MNSTITSYFKQLRLGALARDWEQFEFTNKESYLMDLLSYELKSRESNRITKLIKSAGFNVLKNTEDFIWNSSINIPSTTTKQNILNLEFINKKENIILMGAVGTGKTHLAASLGYDACLRGLSVKFFTASGLANLLIEKNDKGTLNTFMKSLKSVDLVIIDEIGYVPLYKDGAELLFQVISDCYERRSLIVTSNLEFSHWNTMFGDNRLTAAIVDRVIHHSHILIFTGESFRLKQSMEAQ